MAGAAVAGRHSARAQQAERIRRVGVLSSGAAEDPEMQARLTAFLQALQQLGWTEGRNVPSTSAGAPADPDRIRKYVAELVALAPDVSGRWTSSAVGPLQQATRTLPIDLRMVPDPVGAGFVANLARPGGNTTGFTLFEYGIGGKWLALLKQIAPGVTRAADLRDPANCSGIGQFACPSDRRCRHLGIEIIPREYARGERASSMPSPCCAFADRMVASS